MPWHIGQRTEGRLVMPRTTDPWRKRAEVDKPHLTITYGGWEWRVLQAHQTPEGERHNSYASWLCAVKSPYTMGSWDYGDTYIRDIPGAVPGYRGEA